MAYLLTPQSEGQLLNAFTGRNCRRISSTFQCKHSSVVFTTYCRGI